MEDTTEEERIVTVNIYDTHASNANFKVKASTTAADICKIILSKRDILSSESRFFSIVLVVSAFNSLKKCDTHCLRTLKPTETLFEIQHTITSKMTSRYGQSSESKPENADKWYFKDMRTSPIELGATAEVCGEYSSDEDEEISQSDLSYLAKSERKGYLLKRSNSDFNLWRRWYCVLMDQLWCVDISREVPRAKCVKLSGMIRYREGYKTLDQLQIIIINSSDSKSHFFRAFNLIDQKKWIQDLNIKTRVAAENDCFSMAEMIITDEEDAKNFRLVRQVGDVLDQPKVMSSLAFRREVDLESSTLIDGYLSDSEQSTSSLRQKRMDTTNLAELKQLLTSKDSRSSLNGWSEPNFSQLSSPINSPTSKNNLVYLRQNINDPIAAAPVITQDLSAADLSALGVEENVEPEVVAALAGRNVSLAECTPFTHPRACSCLNLEHLEMCERIEGHNLVHETHKDARVVTEILLFVIDVQRYREVLRRELYIPLKKQQDAAKNLYTKYILPQLLLVDLALFPDFSHEMLQLGGGAGPSLNAGSTGTAQAAPSSPYSRNNITNSMKTRSEYSNRLRSRSNLPQPGATTNTSSSATAAIADTASSASAAVHWHVDTEVLMRVHSTLFQMHTRSVELHHSYVTQDPSQLVKYAAGSSKFRGKERSMSVASAAGASTSDVGVGVSGGREAALAASQQAPQPVASFWPWWGSSTPSTPLPSASESASALLPSSSGNVASRQAHSDSESLDTALTSSLPPRGVSIGANNSINIPGAPSVLHNVSPTFSSSKKLSEDKTERPPTADLFDEVVAALITKLC